MEHDKGQGVSLLRVVGRFEQTFWDSAAHDPGHRSDHRVDRTRQRSSLHSTVSGGGKTFQVGYATPVIIVVCRSYKILPP
jgi:hypothetical protein